MKLFARVKSIPNTLTMRELEVSKFVKDLLTQGIVATDDLNKAENLSTQAAALLNGKYPFTIYPKRFTGIDDDYKLYCFAGISFPTSVSHDSALIALKDAGFKPVWVDNKQFTGILLSF